MSTSYRLVSPDGSPAGDADSLHRLAEIARFAPPGRYAIRKLTREGGTGELRSWDWGAIIKEDGGRITLDLPPWLD